MHDSIKKAAKAEGYELVYGYESSGKNFFGLAILVKMSERHMEGFNFHDADVLAKAADEIQVGLETISAEMDPDGSKQRRAAWLDVKEIYAAAGVDAIYADPLPNGYCSQPCCLNKPWFRVTSKIGHVVIGWRKRVMSIDWKDSREKRDGKTLFPNENVTRWETGIHAWNVPDAVRYIRRLHEEE